MFKRRRPLISESLALSAFWCQRSWHSEAFPHVVHLEKFHTNLFPLFRREMYDTCNSFSAVFSDGCAGALAHARAMCGRVLTDGVACDRDLHECRTIVDRPVRAEPLLQDVRSEMLEKQGTPTNKFTYRTLAKQRWVLCQKQAFGKSE